MAWGPFVQARFVAAAAQGVAEVPASFGEQVALVEGAAHHVHHGDGVDGRQGDVDGGRTRAQMAAAAARASCRSRSTTLAPTLRTAEARQSARSSRSGRGAPFGARVRSAAICASR